MKSRELRFRTARTCGICRAIVPAGMPTWSRGQRNSIVCVSCHDSSQRQLISPETNPTNGSLLGDVNGGIDSGSAGLSSLNEFQRRYDRREAQIDARFGRLAGLVKLLTDDPQSISAWKKGSAGERRLAASLMENLGSRAVLLNDRRVPGTRGNIDHLVIAASGVWVVDAKNYAGRIQQRDVGGLFRTDLRLYVGGRDRSTVVAGLDWQVAAVLKALDNRSVPVRRAVCFTDAEWGLFAKPFMMSGTFVSGPNALSRKIAEPGPLGTRDIRELALHLAQALPAKK